MSGFAPVRRATLWIPGTGPTHDQERGQLFVILTDPDASGMNLLVPICSADGRHDPTCLLGAGDHPFLKKKSYVAYQLLRTAVADFLVEQEKKNIVRYDGMLDEKVFALLCAGIEQSRQAAPKFKQYFADQTTSKANFKK